MRSGFQVIILDKVRQTFDAKAWLASGHLRFRGEAGAGISSPGQFFNGRTEKD